MDHKEDEGMSKNGVYGVHPAKLWPFRLGQWWETSGFSQFFWFFQLLNFRKKVRSLFRCFPYGSPCTPVTTDMQPVGDSKYVSRWSSETSISSGFPSKPSKPWKSHLSYQQVIIEGLKTVLAALESYTFGVLNLHFFNAPTVPNSVSMFLQILLNTISDLKIQVMILQYHCS